jgi:hypothetical protein
MRASLLLLAIAFASATSTVRAARLLTLKTFDGVFVHPSTGHGIAGARIELLKTNWSFPFQLPPTTLGVTRTDRYGRFRFTTPSAGPYEIWCLSARDRISGRQLVKRPTSGIRIVGNAFGPPADFRPPRAKRPNQAMQLTASKPAVCAWSVCRRASTLRGTHSGLAAADLVSR